MLHDRKKNIIDESGLSCGSNKPIQLLSNDRTCTAQAFFVGLPMVAFRPSKFAVSFTFGSLLWMARYVRHVDENDICLKKVY